MKGSGGSDVGGTGSSVPSTSGFGPWEDTLQTCILYNYGKDYRNVNYKTGLWPAEIKTYDSLTDIAVVKFNKICTTNDNGDTGWFNIDNVNNKAMFISPEAFWILWQILPYDASNNPLPTRTYGSFVPVSSDTGMVGTTWNESASSNDKSLNTLYANKWSIAQSGGSIYEQNIDFGFGVFDEEEQPDGGYCGIDMITKAVWNPIKLDGLITTDEIQPNTTLGLFGMADNPLLTNTINIDLAGGSNPPFCVLKFEDKVSEPITEFKAQPNSLNPFLVDFTWETSVEDFWYGFLMLSDSSLDNQYTHSLVHIPLDEDGTRTPTGSTTSTAGIVRHNILSLENDSIKAYRYREADSGTSSGFKESTSSAVGSTTVNDIEGLSGWCKKFTDNTNSYIELDFDGGDNDFDTGGGSNEFSLIVHIIPDNTPAADEYIISKEGEYDIWLDSSGNVNARLFQGDAAAASPNDTIPPLLLRGSAIIPMDGQTPTCIIVTLDTNLRANNAKLFINGKLEDQSGLALTAGSPNNWQIGKVLFNSRTNEEFYIGRRFYGVLDPQGVYESNNFDGKIEEVVIYDKVIYPVSPENRSFTYNPILKEMTEATSASSKSYIARLFMKDYHNIRGTTRDQVCASGQLSFRKAGFELDTS